MRRMGAVQVQIGVPAEWFLCAALRVLPLTSQGLKRLQAPQGERSPRVVHHCSLGSHAPGLGRMVVCLRAPAALQSPVYVSRGADLHQKEGWGAMSRSGQRTCKTIHGCPEFTALETVHSMNIWLRDMRATSRRPVCQIAGWASACICRFQQPFSSRQGGPLHAAPPI